MFNSPNTVADESNAVIFHTWGFVLTITYFASAYRAFRQRKTLNVQLAG
jgi:hypothetical protein